MNLSPEELLAHLRMHEIPTPARRSERSQVSEDRDDFLGHSPEASSPCCGQNVEAIADERCTVDVPVQRDERAKPSGMRSHDARSSTRHQRTLIFADPQTLAKALCGRSGGPKQWVGLCPCHADREASLSIRWGRNGGTVIKCHAACKQEDVLEKVRQLGFRLDREPPQKMNRTRRPVSVSTSVAFAACNLSERRMFDLLQERAKNPNGPLFVTYNEFCGHSVRRASIPAGLRAMEALGLITVRRSPYSTRKRRYETNQYRFVERWQLLEPKSGSPQARKAMLARARKVAANARKSEG
jgi:hypothetical protein